MTEKHNDRGPGNYGNPEQHAEAGRQSHKNQHNDGTRPHGDGQTQDSEFFSEIGSIQDKENNPGNFANDHDKASRAGKESGKAYGDTHQDSRD